MNPFLPTMIDPKKQRFIRDGKVVDFTPGPEGQTIQVSPSPRPSQMLPEPVGGFSRAKFAPSPLVPQRPPQAQAPVTPAQRKMVLRSVGGRQVFGW